MEETPQNNQVATAQGSTENTPVVENPASAAPVENAPASAELQTPAPTEGEKTVTTAPGDTQVQAATEPLAPTFNPADWDGKRKQLEKTFVKAFSPRLFGYPFSLEIDVLRGIKAAAARSIEVVEPKQVGDTGGLFWSSVLLEVKGEVKEGDSGIVKLSGEYYFHVAKRGLFGRTAEILDLQKDLNGVPKELYFWHATYPKYTGKDSVLVLIASTDVDPLPVKKEAPAVQEAQAPVQQDAPASETANPTQAAPTVAQEAEVSQETTAPAEAPAPAEAQTPVAASTPTATAPSEEVPEQAAQAPQNPPQA